MTTKTDNIRILHALGDYLFRPFSEDMTMLEVAYTYFSEDTDLERIWRWNNTVDGDEREVNTNHGKRSLSVGDVVGIKDFDGEWKYHSVEPLGWECRSSETVDRALERAKTYNPFEGL